MTGASMIYFEIETQDIRVLFDLLNSPKTFSPGDSVEIPGCAKLVFKGMYGQRTIDIPATLEFLIEHVDPVATSIIATWLYDKLKNKPVRIKFNKKEVDFSEKAIEAMLRQQKKTKS